MASKCIIVSCAVCNSSIKFTEQYLICIKCKNSIHYLCTSLSFAQLEKIDQKNWLCSICDSPGNVVNGINILDMLYQIRVEQKSLKERTIASEKETKKTKEKVNDLMEQFEISIRANGILNNKIAEYEDKIKKLESRDMEASESELITEMLDRQKRAKNILIFNLTNTSHTNDNNIVQNILSAMGLDTVPVKIKRFSGNGSDTERPVKVVFPEETDVYSVLKRKKKLHDHPIYKLIRISPDKTVRQREYYKELLEKVNERKSNGEQDIFIRYEKGNPVIIEGTQNKN